MNLTEVQIQVDRGRETDVREVRTPEFVYRYAYARAADSRAAGQAGQDVLAIRHDQRRFVFTLCDGVSGSFQGDLAAGIVGSRLIDWLWNLPSGANTAAVTADLNRLLQGLTTTASRDVARYPLPGHLPTLLRDVLEQRRDLGSETMVLGARIDRPGPEVVQGRLVLTWLGDSRLRFWGPIGERTLELGNSFHTEERWSSRHGPVGHPPYLAIFPLEDGLNRHLDSVVAYSDGLALLDEMPTAPSTDALNGMIAHLADSPTSDDVSFVELRLGIHEATRNLKGQPSEGRVVPSPHGRGLG